MDLSLTSLTLYIQLSQGKKGCFVEMSRKRFYQISAIVVFVTASLLIAFLVWQYRASQNALIEREQAIQNAIQACNPTYGLQPVEQPTEFQAELTKWGRAEGPYISDPERPVWIVKMKGRWMHVSGGPAPAPDSNPGPFYWDECTIIIDAWTGESLSMPIQ